MTQFGTNSEQPMETYIRHLEERLLTLENATQAQPSGFKEPKLSNPILFSGQRKYARTFILQVKNCIQAQPSRFNSEANKVSFAVSFLRDVAFDWVSPYLETQDSMLNDFQLFEKSFLLAFGDIDRKKHAEDAIFTLRQGNRPVAVLLAEFQKFAFEAGYSGQSLFQLFYRTLNDDVKDEISKYPRPESINDFYALASAIDNRLFERKRERRIGVKNAPTVYSDAPTPTTKQAPSDAMQVDNLQRRGPLSNEEKDRRKRLGLCLYCGSKDHLLANCNVKPTSGKGQARA